MYAVVSMERAVVRLSSFLVRKPVRDDDVVDRLHHNASLILLLLFAAGTALQVSPPTGVREVTNLNKSANRCERVNRLT